MANSEIDILNHRHEVVSIQVVTFQCGACNQPYQVEVLIGDLKMVECPDCGNVSLQMLLGTE